MRFIDITAYIFVCYMSPSLPQPSNLISILCGDIQGVSHKEDASEICMWDLQPHEEESRLVDFVRLFPKYRKYSREAKEK